MRRLLVAAFALGVTTVACTPSDGPSDPSPTASTPGPTSPGGGDALNATTAALLPTDADALPDVDLESYESLLGQLKGTPVLVNFWASWCGPCTREAPHLREASETYGDRVQFLGIDILDDRPSAKAFMGEFGWRYPSLYDVRGAVRDGLGLVGQPVTLIYDRDGEVSFEWNGEISAEQLETELQKVL